MAVSAGRAKVRLKAVPLRMSTTRRFLVGFLPRAVCRKAVAAISHRMAVGLSETAGCWCRAIGGVRLLVGRCTLFLAHRAAITMLQIGKNRSDATAQRKN